MERTRLFDLDEWRRSPDRKPLVLRGARQVGKSFLVREWGRRVFQTFAEVNLERDPAIAACFSDNDPLATLRRLEAFTRVRIPVDGSALLFLDEIQAAPALLAKLRWFAEELPGLPVIAAGSLLDFALRDPVFSMPVGRVSFMHLEPMGFREFLDAMGEELLARAMADEITADRLRKPDAGWAALHGRLMDLFAQYLLAGGMPAAVEAYRRERSLLAAGAVHGDLLAALRSDFSKYAAQSHQSRLNTVLSSVAQQLGGKFRYSRANPGERAAGLKQAVDLLCLARVCHRVTATTATAVPVGAGADERNFKLLLLDAGLVSSLAGLSLHGFPAGSDVMLAHRGALAEQVVGQLLRLLPPAHEQPALFYWQRQARGSEAEVDFVIQHGADVVPVEVKAGATGTLRSLHQFMAERRLPRAVRFNADLPSFIPVRTETPIGPAHYDLVSLPLYAVELLPQVLAGMRS